MIGYKKCFNSNKLIDFITTFITVKLLLVFVLPDNFERGIPSWERVAEYNKGKSYI